ncbi:hypothetical protein QDT91_29480 (plasmid) [Mycolicibacterium aubagnense]|uniref:hypothetical protein n=1 Tax=Mycolicibacterium aubagnense TaxID=319707 RepID=UPI00244E16F4|nr:hypothetical protein [Mycolicibacterium aubagnense]WGI36150.1 hypothetical protein QDT91_29480 [Mycolicibacterium aubagnense]
MTKPRDQWNWWERNGHWVFLAVVVTVTAVTFTTCVLLGSKSLGNYVLAWVLCAIVFAIVSALGQAMH